MFKYFKLLETANFDYPFIIQSDHELRKVIAEYTGEEYVNINNYLRFRDKYAKNEKIEKQIEYLDKAMDKFLEVVKWHKVDTKLTVYRKVYISDIEWPNFMEIINSGYFIDKGYMSTSLINSYKRRCNVLFKIELSSIKLGAFIGNVSKMDNEFEFLIRRDTPFEIIDTKTKGKQLIIRMRDVR